MESVQDKVLNAHGGKKTLVYTKKCHHIIDPHQNH